MPKWDYICEHCGKVEELTFSSLAAAPRIVVCDCGDWIMHRQTPAPAVRIKGFSAKNGYSKGE
jgi:predicted nucleic acid-binding Zn ribbon protein